SVRLTGPPSPHPSPLSLHDALPISDTPPAAPDSWAAQLAYLQPQAAGRSGPSDATDAAPEIEVLNSLGKALTQHAEPGPATQAEDRKSTRLNSSHVKISYAVFCLKK